MENIPSSGASLGPERFMAHINRSADQMALLDPLIRNKDISIGLLFSVVVGAACLLAGLEILGLGAFIASALYLSKLWLRERRPDKPE